MPGRGDITPMSRSHTRLSITATTALALLLAVSGCGALGSSDSSSSSTPGGPVEKPKIKVGVLPVVDMAPFYRAVDSGYFKQEGLDVEVVTAASGPKATESLIGGDLDIAVTSYPGALPHRRRKSPTSRSWPTPTLPAQVMVS
jgi:NitT/TauT family transport system substrate-binding protein